MNCCSIFDFELKSHPGMGIELIGYVLSIVWAGFLFTQYPSRKISFIPCIFLFFLLGILLFLEKKEKAELASIFLFFNLCIFVFYSFLYLKNEK